MRSSWNVYISFVGILMRISPFIHILATLFSEIVISWLIGNKTPCRPIRSVIILVMNKSDSRCAVVRFCYHSYDYRPNWTPLSPITITSRQHVLKKQNVFCNFELNWYNRVIGIWSQVDPGSKVQEQFLHKKKHFCELWPICQELLASKFGKRELVLDL